MSSFNPEKKILPLDRLEKAVRQVLLEEKKVQPIKALHGEFQIEPKIFIGAKISPDVQKALVAAFLSKLTIREVLDERVIITPKRIEVKDEKHNLVLTVEDPILIDNMQNEITSTIGQELVQRQKQELLKPNVENKYTFGQIKAPLMKFLIEAGREKTTNPVKDFLS